MAKTETSQPLPRIRPVLQRKARRWAFAGLLALIITTPIFYFIQPIFRWVASLEGGGFMLAALGLGLGIAAGPLAAATGLLMSLFWRVESCFAERGDVLSVMDRIFIGLGGITSLLPALAALFPPGKALVTGFIGFRGPGQQYFRLEDPYGYWQAVAFWLMGAVTLGIIAAIYWRAKWRIRRNQEMGATQ